jgi:quinone-modifying oxidoreductase subunit QmoC
MAAMRKQALVEYGTPKFLAKFVSNGSLLKTLLVAVVVIALTLLIRFPLEAALKPVLDAFDRLVGMHPHTGTVVYAHFFPHWLLIGLFLIATGYTLLNGLLGILKFWKDMAEADAKAGLTGQKKGLIGSTIKVLSDIMVHKKFGDCGTAPSRKSPHLILVLGFIALFIVTTYAVFSLYVLKVYPFSMLHPMKILGNLGGVALLVGVFIMIMNRKNNPKELGHAGTFDWSFLWVIVGVGITGFLTQFLRFSGPASVAYAVYFIHLIFVFYLLVYLPYSKFGHILYRTVALVYMEVTGRSDAAISATPAKAAASENVEQSTGSQSGQAEESN